MKAAMPETVESQQLIESCRALFDRTVDVSADFLRYLDATGLRSAYRESIKAIHPDRAGQLGISEARLTKLAQRINTAYETLRPYIDNDRPGSRRREAADHFFGGRFPQISHRFATYLYYKKIISWQTLMGALTWQRRARPLIGQIAMDYEMLAPDDIPMIIRQSAAQERFGDTALRMNLLQPSEVRAIVGKQSSYDRKIGRYFVERGTLTADQLSCHLKELRNHNLKVKARR